MHTVLKYLYKSIKPVLSLIKIHLNKTLVFLIPNNLKIVFYYYEHKINNTLDKEMIYVKKILNNKRRFIDIGACKGVYSYYFKNTFKNIDCFEPRLEEKKLFKGFLDNTKTFHNIALSNKIGKEKFYIPVLNGQLNGGRASLEKLNFNCQERTIEVKTLDSFCFDDVDLIKIDVEGHETSVISGATQTIKKCKPILIVEIVQKFLDYDINRVFKKILDLKYDGFFISHNNLLSIKKFEIKKHQNSDTTDLRYEKINNFIFLPKPR